MTYTNCLKPKKGQQVGHSARPKIATDILEDCYIIENFSRPTHVPLDEIQKLQKNIFSE